VCVVGVCARARVCVCVRACVCVRGVRVQLLDQFEADDELWVGIVNSSTPGKAFCAGADLKEVGKGQNIASDKGGFAGIVKYPRTKPLICAVGLCRRRADRLAAPFRSILLGAGAAPHARRCVTPGTRAAHT
jgi:hypothetical protein